MTKQLVPLSTRPKLDYKLLGITTAMVILIPVLLAVIFDHAKVIKEDNKPITMDTITVVATPAAIPTPITVIKTVKQIVKYSKVYSQYTPWKCANGKCRRHVRVYGRI